MRRSTSLAARQVRLSVYVQGGAKMCIKCNVMQTRHGYDGGTHLAPQARSHDARKSVGAHPAVALHLKVRTSVWLDRQV